jgi:putative AlgH/UPF0301 family transcriptional regulator
LEGELEAGGWLTSPATPDQVFSEKDDIWIKLYKHVSTPAVYHQLNPKVIPKDPSMN